MKLIWKIILDITWYSWNYNWKSNHDKEHDVFAKYRDECA